MVSKTAALRTYAAIYEKPYRIQPGGQLYPPTEIAKAAAAALRFQADAIESTDAQETAWHPLSPP